MPALNRLPLFARLCAISTEDKFEFINVTPINTLHIEGTMVGLLCQQERVFANEKFSCDQILSKREFLSNIIDL